MGKTCAFCAIVNGDSPAEVVYEDERTVAFLDYRPLLPGHVLAVPRTHVETLAALPDELVAPFFATVRRMARAVEAGMEAEGSFIAINNTISQSVPHLHAHAVPRWKGDGLFSTKLIWKRTPYESEAARLAARDRIRRAVAALADLEKTERAG